MHGHTNKETQTHSSFSVKQATHTHAQTLNMWRLLQIFLNGSYFLLNLTVQLALHTPFVSPNSLVHFEITSLTLSWMLDSVPSRIRAPVESARVQGLFDCGLTGNWRPCGFWGGNRIRVMWWGEVKICCLFLLNYVMVYFLLMRGI